MGGQGSHGSEGAGSNIPYLKENHANYKEHGSNMTPAPTKDANARTINWTIAATTDKVKRTYCFYGSKTQRRQKSTGI